MNESIQNRYIVTATSKEENVPDSAGLSGSGKCIGVKWRWIFFLTLFWTQNVPWHSDSCVYYPQEGTVFPAFSKTLQRGPLCVSNCFIQIICLWHGYSCFNFFMMTSSTWRKPAHGSKSYFSSSNPQLPDFNLEFTFRLCLYWNFLCNSHVAL